MRRLTTIVVTVLILGSILTVGFGGATSTTTQYQETKTGISMGPVAESNIENFEAIRSTLDQFGVDPPSETSILATSDGKRHLVFSSEPIRAGQATIDGQTYPSDEVSGQIIVADTVSVETTGDRVSIGQLQDNAAEYDLELVRFDASSAVVSTAAKPTSGVSSQQTFAYLSEPGNQSSDLFQQPPGELASSVALIESNGSVERSDEVEPQFPENSLWGQSFSQQFWGEGIATVDAAIVPVYRQGSDSESTITGRELVIVDVNYDGQTLESPADVRDGSYEGEIVTVESDVIGASISAQEYLTSVASCGDKTVSVPMSPPVCVPITNDIVIHAGVMADGMRAGEPPVYYAGVSNAIQNSPTEPETGRYQFTGEVVSTSEIAPSIEDGYALRVYDMERIGDASITSDLESNADQLENRIKRQLELDESEWGSATSSGSNSGGDNGGDDVDDQDGSIDDQSNGKEDSTASLNAENEGKDGGGESDVHRSTETGQTGGTLASIGGSDLGAILGVISVAVFVLGIVLEGARLFKDRYGDTDPNLTEHVTTSIVVSASGGLVVSGLFVTGDWSLLLLLFGGVGIVTFIADYLWRSVFSPFVKQNLAYEEQQSKAVRIVGAIVLFLGVLALLTVLGNVLLSGPVIPFGLQVSFAILSVGIVLFGAVVGILRFCKKHLTDDTLNTAGNMGLAITFVGSIGMTTAGIFGDVFGEGFILFGGLSFLGCFLVATTKAIYKMV